MLNDVEIARHIGIQLRWRRKALGLNQTRLGRMLSVTHSQVGRYEAGQSQLSAAKLVLAARILACPVSYFFEGLDAKSEDSSASRGVRRPQQSDQRLSAISARRMKRRLLANRRATMAEMEAADAHKPE